MLQLWHQIHSGKESIIITDYITLNLEGAICTSYQPFLTSHSIAIWVAISLMTTFVHAVKHTQKVVLEAIATSWSVVLINSVIQPEGNRTNFQYFPSGNLTKYGKKCYRKYG